jgi:hypothetical protein
MTISRLERFHLLCYFGSGQTIPWSQVIQIGTLYIANPTTKVRYDIRITKKINGKKYYQWEMERMLSCGLRDGLIRRVDNATTRATRLNKAYLIEPQDFDYQITEKGRECIGNEQIERAGDYSWYGKGGFDGTIDSAAKINPNLFK